MPVRVTVICFLVVFSTLRMGYAEQTIEVVPKGGFLILEGLQQYVAFRYQFNDYWSSIGNGSSYTTHRFQEIYHVDSNFAVVDPHLLSLALSVELWFQQVSNSSNALSSSSSDQYRYQYSLSGSAFDNRWYPMSFYSSRTLNTVTAPLTPTYDTDTTKNGIQFSLLKDPYQGILRFDRLSYDVTGAGIANTNNTTSNSVSFSASHHYKDITFESVDGNYTSQESTSNGINQSTNAYTLHYSNGIYWGRDKNYSLNSDLQVTDSSTSGVTQDSVILQETFLARLGKALDGQLHYVYTGSQSPGPRPTVGVSPLQVVEQSSTSNSVDASLSHRLYQSLNTFLHGSFTDSNFLGGTDKVYNGTVGIRYNKVLPAKAKLTMGTSLEHQVTDQQLAATLLSVTDEPHIVTQPLDVISLRAGAPLVQGSVTVKGFSVPPPNQLVPPDKTFIEGVDYTVDYLLGRIVWGPIVPTVPSILVSYTARFERSVKYSTDTFDVDGNLTLQGGKYSLSGSLSIVSNHVISGSTTQGLYDSYIGLLRFQGMQGEHRYSLGYSYYSVGPTQYQYFEAWWMYLHIFPRNTTLQLQARDRYIINAATGLQGGYDENTATAIASASHSLTPWSYLTTNFTFIDDRGGRTVPTDTITFQASLTSQFNMLSVNLSGATGWVFSGGTTRRNDSALVDVRRYF